MYRFGHQTLRAWTEEPVRLRWRRQQSHRGGFIRRESRGGGGGGLVPRVAHSLPCIVILSFTFAMTPTSNVTHPLHAYDFESRAPGIFCLAVHECGSE